MKRMLAILLTGAVASVAAGGLREDEVEAVSVVQRVKADGQAIDLRTVFPVAQLENESALQGFAYSAVGWDLDPQADETRTVTITARAGTLENGVFASDGTANVPVLAATTGRGTTDWHVSTVLKKVYQLVHVVKAGETTDASGTLYGYLDFTDCAVSQASQAEVEAAVLGEITHTIAVRQDADAPWQPVNSSAVRAGIATDAALGPGLTTATTFAFRGRGVLHFEYDLTGGTLRALSGGETVLTFATPTTGWVAGQVVFEGYGEHTVAFAYAAAGGGTGAGLRNVRWEELVESVRASGDGGPVRVDLQSGVRTPKKLADILPFEYSSTNWIGDVVSVSAESVARVTVVGLTGTDPDVRNWTDEVPGSSRTLVRKVGESQVRWKARQGVWLATFDILNDDSGIHRETALFDLRKSHGNGFVLFLK